MFCKIKFLQISEGYVNVKHKWAWLEIFEKYTHNGLENLGTLMLPLIYYSKFNSNFDHDLNKLLESFSPISKKISATQLCRVEQ